MYSKNEMGTNKSSNENSEKIRIVKRLKIRIRDSGNESNSDTAEDSEMDLSSADSEIDRETDLNKISNISEPTRKASSFDHSQRLSSIKIHKLIRIVTNRKSKTPQK
ncbi:hypothetical protein V1477_016625 [Vespula maculifrons]|uniref:Uncharacterized protein n=1 Tax=Vespula maculifrons TaxID=7453 RepID=A0ABD2B8T7_VESMC